jgi:hypothetical protein
MTMRVLDTFTIKGRAGVVACVESDGPCPLPGSQLRRVADGQQWTVCSVERFNIYLGTPGKPGEKIGILLSGDPPPEAGDELDRALVIT